MDSIRFNTGKTAYASGLISGAGEKGARGGMKLSKPVMTDGIRIQLFTVRSFSLQFARNLYSEVPNVYSLRSDAIRQYRLDGAGVAAGASAVMADIASSPSPAPSECAVCWDAPAEFAVVPCGHLCLCAGCLGSATAYCPICRTPSTGTCQIYTT